MWSFYNKDRKLLLPLSWHGGNQEKSMNEIISELKGGNENQKLLMFLSKCASGKSAVLLHVIKELGRGIIVVPSILLQIQYKDDYGSNESKYVLRNNGNKLKIGTMFGRKNFVCKYMKERIEKGETVIGDLIVYDRLKNFCSLRGLPCNRTLRKGENRVMAGGVCPYFILPPRVKKDFDDWQEKGIIEKFKNILKCEDIKFYKGIDGNDYGLFIRNDLSSVCDYYKQFYNYLPEYSDVIVMNEWKFKIETNFGRKPLVDIECVDEADQFLNHLNESIDISNLMIDRLYKEKDKKEIYVGDKVLYEKQKLLKNFGDIYEKIRNDENKGLNSNDDYGLFKMIKEFIDMLNEMRHEGKIDDLGDDYSEMLYKIDILNRYSDKAIMSSSEGIKSLSIKYNIPYPDILLKDLLNNSCEKFLMASATIHSDDVLETLFGLKFDKVTLGRKDQPGKLIIMKPKYDMMNVTYENWKNGDFVNHYSNLLKYITVNLNEKGNTLIITQAKKYVYDLIEYLKSKNAKMCVDFGGEQTFSGEKGNLITISYRMKRGVDLKDELARVIVITKYPLPDLSDSYIKSLFHRFGEDTWRILNNIAVQDCIQICCRGLRHDNDWCVFATPDVKVFGVVDEWWKEQEEIKK